MASTSDGIANAIKNKRTEILKLSFKNGSNSSSNGEVIDILSDYPWIADETNTSGSEYSVKNNALSDSKNIDKKQITSSFTKRNDVPYCFIIERESAVNSSFANILNLIQTFNEIGTRGVDSFENAVDMVSKLVGSEEENKSQTEQAKENQQNQNQNQQGVQNNNEAESKKETDPAKTDNSGSEEESKKDSSDGEKTMVNNLRETLKGFVDKITNLNNLLDNNNLNSQIFLPYRYLYITKATEKKYVFPMTTKDASFGKLSAAWGENKKDGPGVPFSGFLGNIVDQAQGIATKISGVLTLVDNIASNIARRSICIRFIF